MKWLIKGGRVLDPISGTDAVLDLLVEDGVFAGMGQGLSVPRGAQVLDAGGLAVIPGLVDMHCHLREPGQEYKETVASGCAAAVKGGVTSLVSMANTDPVNDRAAVTETILEKAKEAGMARVYPAGSVTQGLKGEALSEMGELKAAGCVAVSDDGRPVPASLLRRSLEYAGTFDLLLIDHPEDMELAGQGVMQEGEVAVRLGLEGIPASAEVAAVARDIEVVREFGGRLHLAHLSTAASLELVRRAKAAGLAVTAETCPHYFTLTHQAVEGYDTAAKVRPPLRTGADREAIIAALADGTLDVIATDHAPHHRDEKDLEFPAAAFGISGLETALALTLGLVREGRLGILQALALWTVNPARILGIPAGTLAKGAPADLALVDLEAGWRVDADAFVSKGRNTPFQGMEVKGLVVHTMVGGRMVFGPLAGGTEC